MFSENGTTYFYYTEEACYSQLSRGAWPAADHGHGLGRDR